MAFGARDLEGSRQLVRRRTLRRRGLGRLQPDRAVPDLAATSPTRRPAQTVQRTASQAIFSRTVIDGFAFDAEVVFLTHHLGLDYRRIPVDLINEESSSLSVWRHTLPMLREVFQIRSAACSAEL